MKKILFGVGAFVFGGLCGVVLGGSAVAKVIAAAIDDGSIELKNPGFNDAEMTINFTEAVRQRQAEQAQAQATACVPDDYVPCKCTWPWDDDEKHFPDQAVLDRQMPSEMTEPGRVELL